MGLLPEGQGQIRMIQAAAAGPSLPLTIFQEARVRWRLMGAWVEFVADGNVADRRIHMEIVRNTDTVSIFGTNTPVTTGQTRTFTMVVGGGTNVLSAQINLLSTLPNDYLMNNSTVVNMDASGMQAGDQFTNFRLMVEEWIEPLA